MKLVSVTRIVLHLVTFHTGTLLSPKLPFHHHRLGPLTGVTASMSSFTHEQPRLSREQIRELNERKYVIIPNFLPAPFQEQLRLDIQDLRQRGGHFTAAHIGQDATHKMNARVRVSETCFLGHKRGTLDSVPNPHRENLYGVMEQMRRDLSEHLHQPLDRTLVELLYAYYPQGGFYRKHLDALPHTVSLLRQYSLLLYLNEDWDLTRDQGALRMHFDGSGKISARGGEPKYLDVAPLGGTLVLFESDSIPHEVLDTQKERITVTGWFNRPVTLFDVLELTEDSTPLREALLRSLLSQKR